MPLEDVIVASITIRNHDEDTKARPRGLAAGNGRSMKEAARLFVRNAVGLKPGSRNLAESMRARITPLGGVELEFPPRKPAREPPSFD